MSDSMPHTFRIEIRALEEDGQYSEWHIYRYHDRIGIEDLDGVLKAVISRLEIAFPHSFEVRAVWNGNVYND